MLSQNICDTLFNLKITNYIAISNVVTTDRLMKTLKYVSLITVLALVFTSCLGNNNPEVKTVQMDASAIEKKEMTVDPNATYAKVEFSIDGMTCAIGCAKSIERKMAKMEGVKSAKVDFDKRLAMVEYNEDKVTTESLKETVKMVGDVYKVKDMKTVDEFSSEK